MNAVAAIDVNDLRSIVTLLSLVLFVALVAWTWWPRRRAAHDEAARLPFADAADDAGAAPHGGGR